MLVACAPAQVPGEFFPDGVRGRVASGLEIRRCRHEHAGRAYAALRAAFTKKGLLKGVKFFRKAERLDGFDSRSFHLADRYQAAIHGFSVQENGAGAAFSFGASFFCAGETEILTQYIDQAFERGSVERTVLIGR